MIADVYEQHFFFRIHLKCGVLTDRNLDCRFALCDANVNKMNLFNFGISVSMPELR